MTEPSNVPQIHAPEITPDSAPPLRTFAVIMPGEEALKFRATDFQVDDTGTLVIIRREVVPNLEPEKGGDWKLKNDFVRCFAEGQWSQVIDVAVDILAREEAE